MTEQQIQDKGYAKPDALVSTQWVAEHLDEWEIRRRAAVCVAAPHEQTRR